jgi:hypothetical protein
MKKSDCPLPTNVANCVPTMHVGVLRARPLKGAYASIWMTVISQNPDYVVCEYYDFNTERAVAVDFRPTELEYSYKLLSK